MTQRILILLLLLAIDANAAIRYVDNAATGANNGTSWANAWTSLAGITGVTGGDTVYISGGTTSKTYTFFCFFPPSGSTSNPITYKVGQDAGHNGTVIFNPSSNPDNQAIYLSPAQGWGNWITIDGEYQGQRHLQINPGWNSVIQTGGVVTGFSIRYATLNGQIRMDDSRKTHISYCYWNPTQSIDRCIVNVGRNDSTGFGNNSIHHNTFNLLYQHGSNPQTGNGDDAIGNTSSMDIYNNRFIGVRVTTFVGNQHGDAIQTDGRYIRIWNNYFENAGSNYGVYAEYFGGGGQDWQIWNNVFNWTDTTLTSQSSQLISIGAHGNGTWTNFYIFNNTFRGGNQALAFGDSAGSNSYPGSFLKNNLTMTGSGGLNVWNGTVPNNSNNVQGVASNYFVSPAGGDFRLTSNATNAIDDGSSTGLTGISTTDADGNARGSPWDVGAYEFGAGGADVTAPTLQTAVISANGLLLTLTFDEAIQTGAGGFTGWLLNMNGGAATLGSGAVSGSTVTFVPSRTINVGETGTISYTQPTNGIEDVAGNDLASIPSSPGANVTNSSTAGQVALPTFNPIGGTYFGTQTVTLSSATSGATIYYTVDGSTPTTSSPVYSSPISVSTNQMIRTFASKATMVNSALTSATYEVSSWTTTPAQWKTFGVPAQTANFPWNFRASVSTTISNTVIGLASAVVDEYGDMSVIVRFNDTGTIDVHNNANGNYEALNTVAYTPGVAYSFACSINMTANTYSVSVTPAGGSSTVLATNYAFRQSQSDPAELDNLGMVTVSGSATLDQMTVGSDLTAPTPNPSTFSSNPAPVDAFSVTMTATTALDDFSNPVQYYFDETSGHAGGTDSGWQSSPTYVDSGLSPNTLYTYYVWSRDAVLNQSSPSSSFSATTPAVITGARANCETLNVTTLQVAGPIGSAQTTMQFGFTYPAFTGAGGAMTAPQFVTSYSAAMHHPQQYRNWITEGKDIRLLNPAGIYAKHINIRTIYPNDLSHPNHDYVMNVHPEWLLLNGDGNPVSLFVPEEKCVDFANDDYLDWVLNTWLPTEFVDTTDDDAGLTTFYVHDNGNFLAQTITPNCSHSWCAPYKTDAGMQAAWKHMLDRFKARWPNKKILVSTGPVSYQTPEVQLPRFTDVLAHSDGYFSESLTSDHVYWSGQPNNQKRNALETTMQLADWLAANDKYFFPNLGPGDGIEPTQAEVNYGYAFFNLMRAGTKQFFAMIVKDGSGNWQPEVYPEMNLQLGSSLEARTQISTNVYRRRFANATAYVNLSDSSTNITLPVGTNKNSLGATVTSPLTLGAFSGLTVYHY